ncbi:MAG TPA: hypothetical protein VG694_02280 [Candidatus Paceibacterota bacterium]|jgi:hypothetical protein|nr:hypothetical protein [Candidatus Paceibacterota bacterium]
MENQQVTGYIKDQINKGISTDIITANLKRVGWADDVIYASLAAAQTPVPPPAAKPEFFNDNPELPAGNTPAAADSPAASITVASPMETESVNSPYSIILAVILVVSLFVLMNGLFSDIQNATAGNINLTLTYQGLMVVPFLLVAFLLHSSFRTENRRFRILSMPYFIIGAWVLLRLLWKVAQNLLAANSARGIYIVLGMIIVVLTGIIIFVQKYIKE